MSHANTRPPPARRDWTQGSVTKNLLSLGWPIVIHNALYMLGQTADMIWIGRLGPAAVAGVGVAFSLNMLVLSANMGLVAGIRAMIARAIGGGDTTGAGETARQAFVLSLVYGLLVSILGVVLARPLLGLFGLKPEVVAQGVPYMQLLFIGWFFYSVWLTAFSIMQAAGDPTTPMLIHGCTRALQMALSPLLVFGVWVFPRLEASGAALSIAIAQALGMFISLWVLMYGKSPVRLSLKGFHVQPRLIWRMVRIGLPAAVMGTQANLAQTVLMRLLSPFGTVAVAAHTLNQRVDMMISLPGMGLGQGAAVLVGQNLGAQQPQRAQRTGWIAAGLLECFMVACSASVVVFADSVMRIFTDNPALIATASGFLRIAAIGYLFNGLSSSLQNSISGAGDTIPPMLVSITTTWVVLLPLAFTLPKVGNMGAYGIRWAMVASLATGAVAYTIYFRLGRWKRKVV